MSNPFDTLGLDAGATAAQVRDARRVLAKSLHPDAGGDPVAMQEVNAAVAEALRIIANPPDRRDPDRRDPHRPAPDAPVADWVGTTRDVPSFTIEALPVVAFEALLVAAAELGQLEDEDPPYELRVLMDDPLACWCQLDVVPDAGASTVSVTIAAIEGRPLPALTEVRNAWIIALNGLDWSTL